MSSEDFSNPSQGNPNQEYQPAQISGHAPRTSKLAIWSFVLGLLSLICNFVAGLVGIILGVIALIKIGGSQGQLKGTGFAIAGIACSLLFTAAGMLMMVPAVIAVRSSAQRVESSNNMKQMALAHFNYESSCMKFPAISGNAKGEGLGLSWRVHLLPFMEQGHLYEQFNLNEPWDSPTNKPLIEQMPRVYGSPAAAGLPPGHTVYLRPTGNGAFDNGDGTTIRFSDITDGSSNTFMIVEANVSEAVPWTKPADYQYDPANPRRGLGGPDGIYPGGGFQAGFGDGSVHYVGDEIQNTALKARFTKDGGEVVEW
jgi:hypothetical protein